MIRSVAALLGLLALPAAAQRAPDYYRLDLGISAPTQVNLRNDDLRLWVNTPDLSAKNFQLDAGPLVSGALGWRLAQALRAEVALSHRRVKMRETGRVGGNSFIEHFQGEADVYSVMVNAYGDFGDAGDRVRPYLGGGIGAADNQMGMINTYRRSGGGVVTRRQLYPHDRINMAWSLAAGVSIKGERWTWDLGYRFANFGRIQTAHLLRADGVALNNAALRFGLSGEMKTHEFSAGVRF